MSRNHLYTFAIYLLICLAVYLFFRRAWIGWQTLVIYLLIYALIAASENNRRGGFARLEELPPPGPVQRFGPHAASALFFFSSSLSFLNPFLFWNQLRLVAGQFSVRRRLRGNYPPPSEQQRQTRYCLPFQNSWLVISGGVTTQSSHSWDMPNQRFAYDFVITEPHGKRRHNGRGARLSDYYTFNAPILAAADGEVVQIQDGIRNAPLIGYALADLFCRDVRGNFIVIRHAPGEYGLYAHLSPGSLTVRVGDQVRCGQEIGRCGFSGHATEPHLHFHLQDRADFFSAMGLPVRFSNLHVDERTPLHPVYIRAGQRVKPSQEIPLFLNSLKTL